MKQTEIEARIDAIEYIIDHRLYSEEMEDEVYGELQVLRTALLKHAEDTKEPSEAESILEQRKSQYGDYNTFVTDMKNILNILTTRKEGGDIYDEEDVENFFFVLKLLRMQTADDLDSVTDLSNYAKLARDRRDRDNK
jgi:UDP-N-acetylglucosamine enolpyruvyl transferase